MMIVVVGVVRMEIFFVGADGTIRVLVDVDILIFSKVVGF